MPEADPLIVHATRPRLDLHELLSRRVSLVAVPEEEHRRELGVTWRQGP